MIDTLKRKSPSKDMSVSDVTCPLCQVSLSHLSAELAELHVNGCLDWVVLEEKKAHRAKRISATKRADVKPPNCHETASVVDDQQQQQQQSTIKAEPGTKASLPGNRSIEDMLTEIEMAPLEIQGVMAVGAYRYVFDSQYNTVPRRQTRPPKHQPKPLPAYKRIPGTTFTVDAFKYGALDFCTAYFLTHFHSDHYGGMSGGFSGDLYCSRITANCVLSKFRLDPNQVHALPMNTRCIVQGVYVTLIDAEHCPGAAVILFEIPRESGVSGPLTRIVHTGDFRASQRHVDQIARVFTTEISKPVTPDMLTDTGTDTKHPTSDIGHLLIDYVYLDTTYLEPSYSFPKQNKVIEVVGKFCHDISRDSGYLQKHLDSVSNKQPPKKQGASTAAAKVSLITQWFRPAQQPTAAKIPLKSPDRVLFAVGTYTIGKEKLFIEIAQKLGSKIYVSRDKRRLLDCIASPSITSMLTDDRHEAQVHAVSLGTVNMRGMAEYLDSLGPKSGFSSIVAFSPTGWSHAGPYIPVCKETASLIVPQLPSRLDLDRGVEKEGAGARAQILELAAHIGDDEESAFGLHKLKPRGSSGKITIFPVPYSEHSSFAELARFICSLNVAQVIPTVFSSAEKNAAAASWLRHWQSLKSLNDSRPFANTSKTPE
ncbi:repair protein PSO2 SNM1 [Coemansia erecta]|uniref:Repair protein PSO2 SNM1 n=1 Tax=Coemansia erecta TaxID=147472 RepID=A0A9W8CSY0_9FUNG|nr:repair protein PSO2 SNM1 [Coemansia erecta]